MLKLFASVISTVYADVAVLNKSNFDQFLTDNPKTLVKFYAPWCGHCKKLAPEWEAASDLVEGKVKLAKMDLTEKENEEFKKKFGIKGFPTIKYFDGEEVLDYDGGRTKDKIVAWVNKMTGLPVIFLGSRNEVDDVKTQFGSSSLLAYEGSMRPGNAEFGNFQQFCRDHRSLIQCVAYPGAEGEQPVLELFRPSNTSSRTLFDWETTADEMKKFVLGERLEYFAPISGENYAMYNESGVEVVWFAGTKADYEASYDVIESIAKKTRGHFAWVWIDSVTMAKQVDSMLSVKETPAVVIKAPNGGKGTYRGPSGEEITSEALIKFVKDAKDGKLELILKSEEIPEEDDAAVKSVVAKNLEEVLSNTDEYLLMIYAPWCGHCKSFKPVYEELAEKLKAAGSEILIAKIDGTANDIVSKDLEYTGFPTIYHKSGDKKPRKYTGGRDLNSVVDYLAKNGKADFDKSAILKNKSEAHDEL